MIIEEIKFQINKINFKEIELSKTHSDGRINSSIDEEIIYKKIKNNNYFKNKIFKSAKERNWFDFSINFIDYKSKNEHFFPVNIKIVRGNKNDNLNCKLGLFYALTGKIPHFHNEIGWKDYFEKLKNNLSDNNKDYYFLVINKDTRKSRFIGLREINKLIPNGNNLPFQCNFDDKQNLILNKDDWELDKKRILNFFYESIKKRTTIKDYFEFYFVKNGKIK